MLGSSSPTRTRTPPSVASVLWVLVAIASQVSVWDEAWSFLRTIFGRPRVVLCLASAHMGYPRGTLRVQGGRENGIRGSEGGRLRHPRRTDRGPERRQLHRSRLPRPHAQEGPDLLQLRRLT